MSGKINFIIQSEAWRHPDTQGDKNVYGVKEFYYKKDEFKKFRYIKIGKRKEQYIKDKNLRGSSTCILSIPEEQIQVEQWTTKSGKTYDALSFGDDVTVDKLTGKNGKIFFGYNSTEYLTNEITFKEVNVIQNIGEEYVFPIIEKIAISFSNSEEAKNKWKVFKSKGYCVVEGIDWERAAIYTESLWIKFFSRIGKEFTEAGETNTPIPENTAETHTTETEDTSEPEATGTPPKPETTETSEQTPEPNTTPPPKPISVYDYFEKKMADEDRNLWALVNQYVPGNSKDEKKMLFLSLIRSGLVNENHVDNKRKFIKYDFLKSKLEEIYPQNQGSQNGNPSSGDRLAQTRKNAIQTITVALNLEPAVKESELSSEFHGWNEKINNLNQEEIINDFVKKMLSAIGGKRSEKQTNQKVNDNVNDMKNKTGEELNEKIKENDEASDTKAYGEKKEEIETQKKRSASEDPNKYRRNVAIPGIKNLMAKYDIKENELDDDAKKDWEKIKNGEIQGEEIVEKETKIKQSVGQQGAKKKVKFFENEVEKVLKSGQKVRIEKLKMQMIEFINSDNIFYESKKTEVQLLISRLDSYGNNQQNNHSPKFPWKVVVPVLLLVVILIITALAVIRKRKRVRRSYN